MDIGLSEEQTCDFYDRWWSSIFFLYLYLYSRVAIVSTNKFVPKKTSDKAEIVIDQNQTEAESNPTERDPTIKLERKARKNNSDSKGTANYAS